MELKLIETKKLNNNKILTRELYEIGDYKVEVDTYENGYVNLCTKQKRIVEYLPSIYSLYDFNKEVLNGFDISTTSYGKIMGVDDIREMIKAYEQAIEVVEILTEKFIK